MQFGTSSTSILAQPTGSAHSPGVIEHVIVVSGRPEVGSDSEATVIEEGDRITFLDDRPPHCHAL